MLRKLLSEVIAYILIILGISGEVIISVFGRRCVRDTEEEEEEEEEEATRKDCLTPGLFTL